MLPKLLIKNINNYQTFNLDLTIKLIKILNNINFKLYKSLVLIFHLTVFINIL